MKKALLIILIWVFMAAEVTAVYAETPAFRNFRRGFCNMLTFYLEVGHQMNKAANE